MDHHAFLVHALTFLGAAVVGALVLQKMGLGSVLGYLAAGSIIGPAGLWLMTDVEQTMAFAEFGVVLLLFLIGLELSPRRLWVMRKQVFGFGSLQVGITTIVMAGVAWYLGVSFQSSLIVGAALSLSSTAFALQIMGEKKQLNTSFGRASFGILLFQDLAAIPLLAVIPLLVTHDVAGQEHHWSAFLKVFAVIAGLIVGGRFLLQPFLRLIAMSKVRELFTATTLFLVLGVALIVESVGLSMALGAFLAGLLLADSEHRHALEADIEPFKGLLLGLFFVSVGMSVDYGLIVEKPFVVAGLVIGLLTVKGLLLYGMGIWGKLGRDGARTMALTISQGGEFAFVVFGAATAQNVLPRALVDLLVVVVTLSMAITPILVFVDERFLRKMFRPVRVPYDVIDDEDNRVIIAGFGRVGQIVGRILRVRKIGFTALENDQEAVDVLRRFGSKVYYGDASRLELLEAAGGHKASFLIVAVDGMADSIKIVDIAQQHFPNLKILARARNRDHAYALLARGIQVIHRETLAGSLELTRDLLLALGFDESDATHTIQKFRKHDESMLLQQATVRDNEKELVQYAEKYAQQLSDLFAAEKPE